MALNINGTTGISGVDGSASAPALQGTDSNTGINFASDTVNINTGGSTRLEIKDDGTNSLLQNSNGYLGIRSDALYLQDKTDGHAYITCVKDGAVSLRYDNDTSFQTVSGGTQVPANRKIYVGVFNNSNGFANFSDGSGSATLYIGNQSINTSSDQR
jgi:hypothetical protein